jgi:hypothetical protein
VHPCYKDIGACFFFIRSLHFVINLHPYLLPLLHVLNEDKQNGIPIEKSVLALLNMEIVGDVPINDGKDLGESFGSHIPRT